MTKRYALNYQKWAHRRLFVGQKIQLGPNRKVQSLEVAPQFRTAG